MILISHRGNINGPIKENENKPSYIKNALMLGYDVEIDVWYFDNIFYLGHDKPQYKIDPHFLMNNKLWCHAKNIDALIQMNSYDIHYFWHEKDTITLTSKKYIWAYPSKIGIPNSITVLPELYKNDLSGVIGICSDYISEY